MIEPVSIVTVLGLLVKKAFEKGFEKAGEAGAAALVERFKKKVEHSSAKHEAEGVKDALATLKGNPDDTDAKEELNVYVRKALRIDPHLAGELQQWLADAQPHAHGGGSTHQVANASGGAVVNQVSGSNNSIIVGGK
jgi:hypothetical protein